MRNNTSFRFRFVVCCLLAGLLAGSTSALTADEASDEHQVRLKIFDSQSKIVADSAQDVPRKLRAMRIIVAVATGKFVKDERNLSEEALAVLGGRIAADPSIAVDSVAALGAIMNDAWASLGEHAFGSAVNQLEQGASSAGFIQQGAAVATLTNVLVKLNVAKGLHEHEFRQLAGSLGNIAVSKSPMLDANVRLAATNGLVAKGNLAIQPAVLAKADAEAKAKTAAATSATDQQKSEAKAAADVAEKASAQAAFVLRGIIPVLGQVAAADSLPPDVADLAARALAAFLKAEQLSGVSLPPGALAGSSPPANPGAGSGSSGTASAPVNLSAQPLAAGDQPGVASRLGVSVTRPYDPSRDGYNPKRKSSESLPTTSDAARKARATGATGAYGTSFRPAQVTR